MESVCKGLLNNKNEEILEGVRGWSMLNIFQPNKSCVLCFLRKCCQIDSHYSHLSITRLMNKPIKRRALIQTSYQQNKVKV